MTRRGFFAASLVLLGSIVSIPAAAWPEQKAAALEVTYYYLPG